MGFIEAKDLGDKDLEGKKKTGNKEQFDRYKASLTNLIFTDYLDFHIYQDGELKTKIALATLVDGHVKPIPANFENFTHLLRDFATHVSQNIKSPKKLAEMMAGKARLLSDVIEQALTSDEINQENSTLQEQMLAFKDILIHDITPKGFADVYAQTIAYGMFAARLHDPTLDSFSRQEAAELIPKSNPFLRKLFGYIAGPDIDDRIKWIVENLTEIFLACNVEEILKNYGKATKMEDPIIHFYETFLAEYDPKLRKARGVWYTPAPVVNFIVRAVDDILKTEFNLPQGLADTSKTKIKVKTDIANKNFKSGYTEVEQEVHKVQILDPATGTGTFLAEVIKHVHKKFKGQSGIWSSYAENDLLPRLNGFELLMASYAMAHLQIDLLLKETDFKATKNQRTKIYLTNSLEEYHQDTGTLFANWLSSEANEANHIKRDTPVMCIIGNPPYSGISSNNGKWISDLIEDYKYVDGVHFKERKHWLNDDYVKFLRYGQHFIEKNGSGVLAFINPHGFLDNPTFRGMRWNLLKTYDKIYTIDLHGNSNKKETAPDGSIDQNVFDIQQGVSINIFIKTGKKKSSDLGKVFRFDKYGNREDKYDLLSNEAVTTLEFKEIKVIQPLYLFKTVDKENLLDYNIGFKIDDLMANYITGIMTAADSFILDSSRENLEHKIKDFYITEYDAESFSNKYKLGKNYGKWLIENKSKSEFDSNKLHKITHRPFDDKWTYYDKNFLWRSRSQIMDNYFNKPNIGLITAKSNKNKSVDHFYISKVFSEAKTGESSTQSYNFPLYLYPETTDQKSIEETTARKPNLDLKIVKEIAGKLKLEFVTDHENLPAQFAELTAAQRREKIFTPLDLLDYIYAVLHSPSYREKYKEFLKIDFPRVPYPGDVEVFWELVALGGELRQLHLLESDKVDDFITNYTGEGDNTITRKLTKTDIGYEPVTATHGKVWINDDQYFDQVPLLAWEFYIGGYQPAQKWLKDRKGRKLDYDDIFHYSKIIVSLTETARIMEQIDGIVLE